MKRDPRSMLRTVALAAAGACMLTGLVASAQLGTASTPLSEWMPSEALVYIEAADFAGELSSWNDSETKAEWLASVNHDEFLTTRLMLKLRDVYGEFSEASGFGPDMAALQTVAGDRTALALYDIRELHFLYISRLPSARLGENALTRAASAYETRTAGEATYYVREAGSRVSAFAFAGEYLLASTREDLITSALERIAGEEGVEGSVAATDWYQEAFAELEADASGPVPLRMVMDLPRVVATPYFRSYWIQHNADLWDAYDTFLAQLTRSDGVLEEARVFVRTEPVDLTSNRSAAAELLRFVPDEVGLFRLWDTAGTASALELIQTKYFATGDAVVSGERTAPVVNLSPVVGSIRDLATRIDEPPKPSLEGSLDLRELEALMSRASLQAALHLEKSFPLDRDVFVSSDAALAFHASSDWNLPEVQAALSAAVQSYQSVGRIGLEWRDVVSGTHTLSRLDGLLGLTVYVDGPILWIARTPELLGEALRTGASRDRDAQPTPGAFTAAYDHGEELDPYLRIMRMLDLSEPSRYSSFFSENVGSLASVLDHVETVRVSVDDDGRVQRQVVSYELRP